MPSLLAMESFSDELQKIAARKGVKLIGDMWGKAQKAFAAGDTQAGTALMERANKLSKTPGVVKPSAAGSQIQSIGRGSEGAVSAVADPEFGLSARKLYDPKGIATPELIRRKDVAGKALGKSEDVAEYYGQRASSQGGTMQFSELVPQAKGAGPNPRIGPVAPHRFAMTKRAPDYADAKSRAAEAYRKTSKYGDPQDVRAANMVRDARTGKLKTVDAIPAERGEFLSQPERAQFGIRDNELAPMTRSGENLTKQPEAGRLATGKLHSSLLGPGSPRPPRSFAKQMRSAGVAPAPVSRQAGTVPNRPSNMPSRGPGTAVASPSAARRAAPKPAMNRTSVGTVPSRPKNVGVAG